MGKNSKNNEKPKLDIAADAEKTAVKKRLTRQQLIIMIVSAVLLVAIVASLVFLVIIPTVKKDKNFDYLKSDLSKYLTLSEQDYKNLSLNLSIAPPREIDVDVAILGMLTVDKGEVLYEGAYQTDVAITPGDIANIYYRGYVIEDGKERDVMSNLTSTTYTALEIGAGDFPARGFELGLVGIVPAEHTAFTKIKSGTVSDGQVIYLSYERLAEGAEDDESTSGTSVRIDLSNPNIADTYGTEFKERILGKEIGAELTFSTTIDGKTYNYTNTTVDFVTECEDEENVIKIEAYFPYNSGVTSLNNKTVYFDVYVKHIQVYENPEFNDEYITEKVAEVNSGIRMDELEAYEGTTLVEKYRAYVEDYLEEQYEAKKRELIITEIWNNYDKLVDVKKVPGGKVDDIYYEYYSQVKKEYEASGGVIYNELTEETETYTDDIDGFAKVYLGLWYAEDSWTDVLYELAEDLVIERMILYYIMKEENLTPTAEELSAKVDELKAEYMEEYIYQYLEDFDENRADFEESTIDKNIQYAAKMNRIIKAWKANDTEDAEYAQFVAEREAEMYAYYDDDYFTETAYYEIVVDVMVTWPEVTVMGDSAIQ